MVPRLQVVFDAGDPHLLARFWADVLHYEVEHHGPFVEQLVADGRLPHEETIEVDGQRAFRDVAACADPAGAAPRLFFQRVPEPKTVKNRVHVDVQVGAESAAAEVERLQALGATVAWTTSGRGPLTTTMRDPEGNEFCVS
jgi:hypothetical protein